MHTFQILVLIEEGSRNVNCLNSPCVDGERREVNRKIALLALVSVPLLLYMGIFFQLVKPVRAAATWTVDDDGPADFSTIQEAINAASPGDTIFVRNGIYYEIVVVNKTVSLVGESKETTIVNGNGS